MESKLTGRKAFCANLGFLWNDLPLTDRILNASNAGFGFVECHWPFGDDPVEIGGLCENLGLGRLSINTRPGETFGLSAVPGLEIEAREAIDEAIRFARTAGFLFVHVMAGKGTGTEAKSTFIRSLIYACDNAPDLTFLIEPINLIDVPGYFLNSLEQAELILDECDRPNLKIMFDCYHAARSGEDVVKVFSRLISRVGHIQIAGVPARGSPINSDLDYGFVLAEVRKLGWSGPIGAEYSTPQGQEPSFDWMDELVAVL